MNYTYILRCNDGSLYTGWTNDLANRIKMHNEGLGAKYTRAHRPVELVYFEEFDNRSDAMKRESAIKKLSRKQKESLVNDIESYKLKLIRELSEPSSGSSAGENESVT